MISPRTATRREGGFYREGYFCERQQPCERHHHAGSQGDAEDFSAEGVETEVIQLGNQPIRDCIQCGYCGTHDACVFRDDAVNQFTALAKEADGFVFATPVYYAHPSGRILAFSTGRFYSVQNVENPFALKARRFDCRREKRRHHGLL